MILQRLYAVVDCPVCGRPVEIHFRHIHRELECAHCGGQFVVSETGNDGPTASKLDCGDALQRADNLLRSIRNERAAKSAASMYCRRSSDENIEPSLEIDGGEIVPRPTAILVEHRDEVFARIATDMAESGMRVVRAKSAAEALELFPRFEPTLVVANINLPDQNGWLLARKLSLFDRRLRVWLYQPFVTTRDEEMAKCAPVDEWLVYLGDLLGLSESIIALASNRRKPDCNSERSTDQAAA